MCFGSVLYCFSVFVFGFSRACVRVPCFRVLRTKGTFAEWLRRRLAKPMGYPRAGSNPIGVGSQLSALRRFDSAKVDVQKQGCSGN